MPKMVKIRALRGFASLHYSAAPGRIIEVHEGAAEDLIRAGHAELVEELLLPAPEKKMAPPRRKKRGSKTVKKKGAE